MLKGNKLEYNLETQEIIHRRYGTVEHEVYKHKVIKCKCSICGKQMTVTAKAVDNVYFIIDGRLKPFCRNHKPKVIPVNVYTMIQTIKSGNSQAYLIDDINPDYIPRYNTYLANLGYKHWKLRSINKQIYLIQIEQTKEKKREAFDTKEFSEILKAIKNVHLIQLDYTLKATADKINRFIIDYNRIDNIKPINICAFKHGKFIYVVNNDIF